MSEITVELIRKFAPLSSRSGHWDSLYLAPGKSQGWHKIDDERRALLFADPGAGKTFEALSRARKIRQRGTKRHSLSVSRAIDVNFGPCSPISSSVSQREGVIGVMDNTAIERIATPDLTAHAFTELRSFGPLWLLAHGEARKTKRVRLFTEFISRARRPWATPHRTVLPPG
jgi:hypothetical protein